MTSSLHNVRSATTDSSRTTDSSKNNGHATSQSDTVLVASRMSQLSLAELEERKQNFKRLELLKTVGTGSYGRVLVARDRETSQFYALKILSITHIVQSRQVDHVKNEKDILLNVKNPFIIQLHWTHHDDQFLFMLFEYVPGGELFTYMRRKGTFDLKTSLFYICEIVLAFEYLHSLSIIYRDLKPENILLDADGHVKLVDFGFAKKTTTKTFTTCGTPDYLSPELFKGHGHNKSTDWWSLGILLYEMLTGVTPFNPNQNENEIMARVLAGRINWHRNIDDGTRIFLKKLLNQNPEKRLGAGVHDAKEIKEQPIFASIKWHDIAARKVKGPIIPTVNHAGDTSCFDSYPEDWQTAPFASDSEVAQFRDF